MARVAALRGFATSCLLRVGSVCAVCIRNGGGLSKIFRGSLSEGRGGKTGLGISNTGGEVGR